MTYSWLQSKLSAAMSEADAPAVYLDHAAATPMWPAAIEAMHAYLTTNWANPSAIHGPGVRARRAVEAARQRVATQLGIQSTGVVFTGNGTESNNVFLQGVVAKHEQAGKVKSEMVILSTRLEHAATIATLQHLEREGVNVVWLPVQSDGRIDQAACREALDAKVVAVSVGYVNSEVGTIESVGAISRLVRAAEKQWGTRIYLHVDAAQAPLWLPCQLPRLHVDCLSLDAGKFGGPKGVGILAWHTQVTLAPTMFGGGQEAGLRPGTENVAGVVATAIALDIAQADAVSRALAVAQVRDYGIEQLHTHFPDLLLNGPTGDNRVANNINVSIPGLDTEYAVIDLATHGIAASTKSACSSAGGGQSGVVLTLTNDPIRAASTLRFTLGPNSSNADIDQLVAALTAHLALVAPVSHT